MVCLSGGDYRPIFFGRNGEQSLLKRQFGLSARHLRFAELRPETTCRVLTLIGPGGVGKMRRAVQAAADAADSFRHGVCFAPLRRR